MSKNRSESEGLLEGLKEISAYIGKIPCYTLPSKSDEWNYDVKVISDKTSVEITEAQEGLNVFDIPGLWPFQDYLDFVSRHPETLRREYVAEIFYCG